MPFHFLTSYASHLLFLLVIALLLSGCAPEQQTVTEKETAEQVDNNDKQLEETYEKEKQEHSNPATTENSYKNDAKKPGDVTATVTNVVDGDTIDIKLNGREKRVRLLLVDTPETVHPSKPIQPYGPEASTYAKETLSGENVRIEYDGPKRDHYDRLLAYIWIEGKNFNKSLLEKGLARYAYEYDPPYTHADTMQEAERTARKKKTGIWSMQGYVTEKGFNEENKEKSPPSSPYDDRETSYDPDGPDRDCGDFSSQEKAQAFYEAAGGPSDDSHRLDGTDKDGVVCESI